jgi:hypothetical protein
VAEDDVLTMERSPACRGVASTEPELNSIGRPKSDVAAGCINTATRSTTRSSMDSIVPVLKSNVSTASFCGGVSVKLQMRGKAIARKGCESAVEQEAKRYKTTNPGELSPPKPPSAKKQSALLRAVNQVRRPRTAARFQHRRPIRCVSSGMPADSVSSVWACRLARA